MYTIIELLNQCVSNAFEEAGYDAKFGTVTISDRADLCQFQCNGAFGASKQFRQAPFIAAEKVAEILLKSDIGNPRKFEKIEAVKPGFINITLADEYLAYLLNEIINDANRGIPLVTDPQTIVIDYGGPNVAKPLHIGHLRAAIIGESIKRLASAMGNKVIGDVHLGDWGLQMGLIIAELKERYGDSIPEITVDMLSEVYPFASAKSKNDEVFKDKAQEITSQLQSGHPEYIKIWKEIIKVSVSDLKNIYSSLSVNFDLWYGESDAQEYVDELVGILNEKNLLIESDGALIVDVSENDSEPMPPVLIKTSNNSNLYATTDLATILQRMKDFNPDKIWYVVDNRQSLHFKQVFRCAAKAGIVSEKNEMEFLGFGTMNGSDGKPYKTREGGVMKLEDLIKTVTDEAFGNLVNSEHVKAMNEEEKRTLAKKIAISAVKFGDLINHRSRDYIFDIDKFLSFEGKTGPYILYNVTRINSILKKTGADGVAKPLTAFETKAERDLILKLICSGEVFKQALADKAPNYICENAYQLANNFSKLYQCCNIANEPNEERKNDLLALISVTKRTITAHLDTLGIETVENM